jgi:hypothetical protein
MVLRRLATLNRLLLKNVARLGFAERVGNLHQHLAFAMWAEAFLAGVFIFDSEDVSVGTFDLNSHGRPTSGTAEDQNNTGA